MRLQEHEQKEPYTLGEFQCIHKDLFISSLCLPMSLWKLIFHKTNPNSELETPKE